MSNRRGVAKHPVYGVWADMKQRCYNKNLPTYKNYGGRGIRVCDSWRDSFLNFLSDMGTRPDGASLDRIDNDGDYTPNNCRWASWHTQAFNKSNTLRIEYGGVTMSIDDWSNLTGLTPKVIRERMYRGWTPSESVSIKSYPRGGRRLREFIYGEVIQ